MVPKFKANSLTTKPQPHANHPIKKQTIISKEIVEPPKNDSKIRSLRKANVKTETQSLTMRTQQTTSQTKDNPL